MHPQNYVFHPPNFYDKLFTHPFSGGVFVETYTQEECLVKKILSQTKIFTKKN